KKFPLTHRFSFQKNHSRQSLLSGIFPPVNLLPFFFRLLFLFLQCIFHSKHCCYLYYFFFFLVLTTLLPFLAFFIIYNRIIYRTIIIFFSYYYINKCLIHAFFRIACGSN